MKQAPAPKVIKNSGFTLIENPAHVEFHSAKRRNRPPANLLTCWFDSGEDTNCDDNDDVLFQFDRGPQTNSDVYYGTIIANTGAGEDPS